MRVRHLPTFVSIEPANLCQLRCPECPVGRRKNIPDDTHYLSLELFEKILSEVQSTAHTIQFYFQGEPLLNECLPRMITQARQVGLYTIVSTNAQALNKEMARALVKSGLSRIIVSIDGFSEESYAAYRIGGSLHRALAGLRFLRDSKDMLGSAIRIELQVLRLRSNEHEWQWIRRNYKSLGATHLVFKTAQLYDYEHGHPLMPTNERYSRYKKQSDGTYRLHRFPFPFSVFRFWFTPCYRLWSGCVIATTGEILPCCYDKAGEYAYGLLLNHSLASVWRNKKADEFRRQVIRDSNKISICKECWH